MCPHCFIPEINMFENKIEGHKRQVLLGRLKVLYRQMVLNRLKVSHGITKIECIIWYDQFEGIT